MDNSLRIFQGATLSQSGFNHLGGFSLLSMWSGVAKLHWAGAGRGPRARTACEHVACFRPAWCKQSRTDASNPRMRISAIFGVFLNLAAANAADTTTLTSVDYFRRASEQLANGNDQQAITDFKKALAANPGFKPAQYNLAASYLRLGKAGAALDAAANCADPRCTEVAERARQYEALYADLPTEGDCLLYNRLLDLAPKSTDALKARAECFLANDKTVEAVTDLTKVAQLDYSDDRSAARAAVGSFVLLDQRQQAMQILRRCVSYDDESVVCRGANKDLRKLEKRLKESPLKIKLQPLVKDLRALLEKYSIPPGTDTRDGTIVDKIRQVRCEHFAMKELYDPAAKVCAQVRDFDPDFLPARLVQAHVDAAQGNGHEAVNTWRSIIREFPNDKVAPLAQKALNEFMAEEQQRRQEQHAPVAVDKDFYKILGVDEKASKKEIRKAYRQLSKTYHPDKYKGKELNEQQVMEKMQEINEAYETLSNDDKRQDYDSQRSGGGSFGGNGFGGQFPGFQSFQGFQGFRGFQGFQQ